MASGGDVVQLVSGKRVRTGESAASAEAGAFTVVETVDIADDSSEWSTVLPAGCPFGQPQQAQTPPQQAQAQPQQAATAQPPQQAQPQ